MSILQSTKLSSRHQTVVPAHIRKILKLKAGDQIQWRVVSGQSDPMVIAQPKKSDRARSSRGLGKHVWKNISVKSYIDSLRNEWEQ